MALKILEATGLRQSEAIRAALLSEVRHRRRCKELAAEVAALEAHEVDRDEMLGIAFLRSLTCSEVTYTDSDSPKVWDTRVGDEAFRFGVAVEAVTVRSRRTMVAVARPRASSSHLKVSMSLRRTSNGPRWRRSQNETN